IQPLERFGPLAHAAEHDGERQVAREDSLLLVELLASRLSGCDVEPEAEHAPQGLAPDGSAPRHGAAQDEHDQPGRYQRDGYEDTAQEEAREQAEADAKDE